MIIVKQEENGQSKLRTVTNEDVILEEKIIDGKTYYMPLKAFKLKKCNITKKYAYMKFQSFSGKIYIYDFDTQEKVRRIYDFDSKRWIETSYDHLKFRKFEGEVYIHDINVEGKIKRIYDFERKEWYHVNWCHHLEFQKF